MRVGGAAARGEGSRAGAGVAEAAGADTAGVGQALALLLPSLSAACDLTLQLASGLPQERLGEPTAAAAGGDTVAAATPQSAEYGGDGDDCDVAAAPSPPLAASLTDLIVALASVVAPFAAAAASTAPARDPQGAGPGAEPPLAPPRFIALHLLAPQMGETGKQVVEASEQLDLALQRLLHSSVSLLQRVPPCCPLVVSEGGGGSVDLLGAYCCPALLGLGARLMFMEDGGASGGGIPRQEAPPTSSPASSVPLLGTSFSPSTASALNGMQQRRRAAARTFLDDAASALSDRAEGDADVAASGAGSRLMTSMRRRSTAEHSPWKSSGGGGGSEAGYKSPFGLPLSPGALVELGGTVTSGTIAGGTSPRAPLEAVAAVVVLLTDAAFPSGPVSSPLWSAQAAPRLPAAGQPVSSPSTDYPPLPSGSTIGVLLPAALALAGRLGGHLLRFSLSGPAASSEGGSAAADSAAAVATAARNHLLLSMRRSLLAAVEPKEDVEAGDSNGGSSERRFQPAPQEQKRRQRKAAVAVLECTRVFIVQAAPQLRKGGGSGQGTGAADATSAAWVGEVLASLGPAVALMTRRAIRAAVVGAEASIRAAAAGVETGALSEVEADTTVRAAVVGAEGTAEEAEEDTTVRVAAKRGEEATAEEAGAADLKALVACAKEGLRLLAAAAPIVCGSSNMEGRGSSAAGAALMRVLVPLLIEAAAAPSATQQRLGGNDSCEGTAAWGSSAIVSLRESSLRLVTSLPTSPAAGGGCVRTCAGSGPT